MLVGVVSDELEDARDHAGLGVIEEGGVDGGVVAVHPHLGHALQVKTNLFLPDPEPPHLPGELPHSDKDIIVEMEDIGIRHVLNITQPQLNILQEQLAYAITKLNTLGRGGAQALLFGLFEVVGLD